MENPPGKGTKVVRGMTGAEGTREVAQRKTWQSLHTSFQILRNFWIFRVIAVHDLENNLFPISDDFKIFSALQ